MSIRFTCRNGHVLKADVRHAGRKMRCPRCRVGVWVPQPERTRETDAAGILTDTQAVRLLGSYHPNSRASLVTPSASSEPDDRMCPQCRQLVPSICRVCPNCNTYLGVMT